MITTAEAIKQIQFNLGKIDGTESFLELSENDIQLILNNAIREMTNRVDTPAILQIPFASVIDIRKFKIAEIFYILRNEPPVGLVAGAGLDPFYMSTIAGVSQPNGMNTHHILQTQAQYAIRAMAQNTIQSELTYMTDIHNGKLYISFAGVRPKGLSIVYKPVLEKVEDFPTDYWVSVLLRLATGQAKIILGNLRSKYTVSNSSVTLNGQSLLEQGKAEVAEVYELLKNNLKFDIS